VSAHARYTSSATGRGMRGALLLAQSGSPGPSATCSRRAALGPGLSLLETAMVDETQEEWRLIGGFPGYEVSSLGRVRCWNPINRNAFPPRESRMLRPGRHSAGYLTVCLVASGKHRSRYVHRLVLEAFVGPSPSGMECRHRDGDRQHNVLSNLAWGTCGDQVDDRRRHGTLERGEAHHASKLTEQQVREIRRTRGTVTETAWADRLGVNPGAIYDARSGRNWKWVE